MKASFILNNSFKTVIKKISAVLFWIAVWLLLFKIIDNSFLLCSPFQIARKISELVVTKDFWITTLISIVRVSVGYVSGIIIGLVLAILSSANTYIEELLSPLITVIKTTPVASFILLVLVWIKKENVPSFISFIMVLPIAWSNISMGISRVDKKMKEVGKIYKLSAKNVIKHIYIPSVKPYFLSACTTSLGLSWKAGVAAGVLSQPNYSIGANLYSSKIYLETDNLFAWTAVVIIISLILEKAVKSLINRVRG